MKLQSVTIKFKSTGRYVSGSGCFGVKNVRMVSSISKQPLISDHIMSAKSQDPVDFVGTRTSSITMGPKKTDEGNVEVVPEKSGEDKLRDMIQNAPKFVEKKELPDDGVGAGNTSKRKPEKSLDDIKKREMNTSEVDQVIKSKSKKAKSRKSQNKINQKKNSVLTKKSIDQNISDAKKTRAFDKLETTDSGPDIARLKKFLHDPTKLQTSRNVKLLNKYLPLQFILSGHILSPFNQYSRTFRGDRGRLGVTTLLKQSCELKQMYSLYLDASSFNNLETVRSKSSRRGTTIHRQLENEAHPFKKVSVMYNGRPLYIYREKRLNSNPVHGFEKERQEKEVLEDTEVNNFAEEKVQSVGERVKNVSIKGTANKQRDKVSDISHNRKSNQVLKDITRLIQLFQKGKCSEVQIHSTFSRNKNCFVSGGCENSINFIPISGTIDELKLTSENPGELEDFQLKLRALVNEYSTYDDVIDSITQYGLRDDNKIKLITKEYKTKSAGKMPSDQVINTDTLQAGIYQMMLKVESEDANLGYKSRIERFVDGELEKLDNGFITMACLNSRMFFQECLKMKYGKVKKFGNSRSDESTTRYEYNNMTNYRFLNMLNGEWKFTPTVGHLVGILARIQNSLKYYISEEIEVEYLNPTSDLSSIGKVCINVNKKSVVSQIKSGLSLWLGEREPLTPQGRTYCMACEFRKHCRVWHYGMKNANNPSD